MNASPVALSDRIDTALPGSLRQHPALQRLRVSLQAQCPERDTVEGVCARLLAVAPDATVSPPTALSPTADPAVLKT